MKNFVSAIIFFLFICSLSLESVQMDPGFSPSASELTYSYSRQQIEPIKELAKPQSKMTVERYEKIKQDVQLLLGTSDLSGLDQTILPAYLANAQKDAAWISYQLTGRFTGDLGPVTLWILQMFLPNAELPSIHSEDFDPFSSAIASLVVAKSAKRLNEERSQLSDYPIKQGKNIWTPTSPGYTGLNYGSVKTWFLKDSEEFIAEAPPSETDQWEQQCETVVKEQDLLNGKKRHAVFWWASLPSPKSGRWSYILQDYLNETNATLAVRLYSNALFESALADSNAAAFNSKYTYWVPRPSQRDPNIKPMIEIPNHPSYPSAHSTIGATAAMILTELFPQNKTEWDHLAEEAGMSRIWGGIHYPCDHESGLALGDQVGKKILSK